MARLNVEDQFWIEVMPLAIKLGNQDIAIGQVLRFWKIIQEKHKYHKFMSEDEFRSSGLSEYLFDSFAIKTENGITARGAEKHFNWLRHRINSGKAGGKQTQSNRSKLKQAQPSSSSSSSSSISNSSKNTYAHFEKCALEIYALYPKKVGKKAGWVKMKGIIKTEKDFENLKTSVINYTSFCEKRGTELKYIKQFDTFLTTWEDWLDPTTGTGRDFKKTVSYLTEEDIGEGR